MDGWSERAKEGKKGKEGRGEERGWELEREKGESIEERGWVTRDLEEREKIKAERRERGN